MITQDRLELNNRFIKVFSLMEDRGVVVKNDRDGKGMGDFAEKILGNKAYGHIVRAFLNPKDKRVIDYHHARAICKEYGINEKFMLEGIGSPFGMDLSEDVAYDSNYRSRGNILFTTTEAFAGSSIGQDGFAKEDLEYFSVPGVSGSGYVAFPIRGNSMEPVINHGDVVICQEVNSVSDIRDKEMYAVKANGSLWVKYVQKVLDNRGRITHLKLISANHFEHDPFEEEVNEYMRLYKVIKRITEV